MYDFCKTFYLKNFLTKLLKYLITFCLLAIYTNASSQYVFEWNTYYDNHSLEQIRSIVKGPDNYIYIVGLAQDTNDVIWLLKIDASGKKVMSKFFGGFKSIDPVKIITTNDKKLAIIAIATEPDTAQKRIWLGKIDLDGNLLWERLYPGVGVAMPTDIVQTPDSGFAISGYSSIDNFNFPDWYIIKADKFGYFQWDRSFGSQYDDRATSLTLMYDSTIVVGGFTSYGFGDFKKGSITKVNLQGDYIWAKDFKFGFWSSINTLHSTTDSNLVVVAELMKEPLLNFDTYIYKLNNNADVIWQYQVDSNILEHPVSIIETYDQGYALAYTWKKDGYGNTNVAAIKLSPLGNLIWNIVFYRKSDDFASQITEGPDNSLIIGASTNSLDKSWNYGVVKYRSIEASDLVFIKPYSKKISINTNKLPVEGYILGYKKPKLLKIYNNRNLVDSISDFQLFTSKVNSYFVQSNISLKQGYNEIDFVVTDYKDFKFVRTLKVYYIPTPKPIW